MHRTAVRIITPTLLLAALGPLTACDREPVDWNDAAERSARVPPPPPSAAHPSPDAAADSILRATLRAAVGDTSAEPVLPGLPPDVLGARGVPCPTSIRAAAGRGGERDGAWWAVRPDSSASLLVARTPDGGARWLPALAVDTLDRAVTGCARPAPAVAVDAANGYLHVAYSLVAPEGTGVFYAHRMGPDVPFERPQVITYGDHVTPTSVASAGDLVVVAYEDPNTGGRPYVSIAISRTAGHSWDERLTVSSSSASALRPLVALRGRTIAVGWVEQTPPRVLASTDDANTAAGASQVVVRVGRIR
jgi:hypothetical protein